MACTLPVKVCGTDPGGDGRSRQAWRLLTAIAATLHCPFRQPAPAEPAVQFNTVHQPRAMSPRLRAWVTRLINAICSAPPGAPPTVSQVAGRTNPRTQIVQAHSTPRMFSALQPIIYVQVSAERLTLKNLKTGGSISEVPELAMSAPPKRNILAVGPQARVAAASQSAEVVNPFAHPRTMVSDFTVAEQLLKHQLRRVLGNSLLALSPHVVIHPLGSPAGGFTQVERRAFREMALGAGASKVHVWTGRPLTDQEVLSRRPPSSGGEWE